jgi:hypothetical protein
MMGGVLGSSGMNADQSAVGDGCHEHPFIADYQVGSGKSIGAVPSMLLGI